jgi:hypothetical protein
MVRADENWRALHASLVRAFAAAYVNAHRLIDLLG